MIRSYETETDMDLSKTLSYFFVVLYTFSKENKKIKM